MAASQPGYFSLQEFTDLGVLAVGGRLYTYSFGTTTHKTAYTDAAGLVPQTYTSDGQGGQYIALNARGELPAPLYLAYGSYDLTLKTAAGATVWTRRADAIGDFRVDVANSTGATLMGWIQAGSGAVARTVLAKLRETVSITDFGVVGDGTADNSAALAVFRTWALAQPYGTRVGVPPGKYNAATWPNLGIDGLTLNCHGKVEFHSTGAGITIDAGASTAIYGMQILGFPVFSASAGVAIALDIIRPAQCVFDIRAKDAEPTAGNGIVVRGAVSCKGVLICSTNRDTMTSIPFTGVLMTSSTNGNATNNEFFVIGEGVGRGLYLLAADFNTIHGTTEGCTVRGTQVDATSSGNKLVNLACESNGTEDILDQGVGTEILGGYSKKAINLVTSKGGVIRGGRHQTVTIDATSRNVTAMDFSISNFAVGGVFTDAGTNTSKANIYNTNLLTQTVPPVFRVNPVSTITNPAPGASPYAYTNTTGYNQQVLVRGGTVSQILLDRGAVSTVVGGAGTGLATSGFFFLQPSDKLTVSYSVVPEMLLIPM